MAAIQITKMLASRLSPFSIRVNAVCPGIFPSEMTGSTEELTKKDNPWGNLIATIPLGKLLTILPSSHFFCSHLVCLDRTTGRDARDLRNGLVLV